MNVEHHTDLLPIGGEEIPLVNVSPDRFAIGKGGRLGETMVSGNCVSFFGT